MSPQRRRWAVGLISGTSMDGIDAALVELRGSPARPRIRLSACHTIPYPSAVRRRLMSVASGRPATSGEISGLNFLLGDLFAEAALAVCRKGRVPSGRLSVIGSHGQTVFHRGPGTNNAAPRPFLRSSTLQIGEPSIIAQRTGAPVVADFRPADMAAGGNGAPLVPLADYLLFGSSEQGVVALNVGGIANITVIPAAAAPTQIFGFDTGPGNMVMDALARHLSRGRRGFDPEGRWARRGATGEPLLAQILRLPFFRRRPPKCAGREQFGHEFVNHYFLRDHSARPEDLLRTATELTARSVADAIRGFVMRRVRIDRMIVSGGGVHNVFLLDRLQNLLPEIVLAPSDHYGVPAGAKEAMAFALLADRTLHGLPGNLPKVTGARRPVILGKLVRP